MFKSFSDYVEDRKSEGGLVGQPKVKVVADYDGPTASSPPKSKGASSAAPYKTPVGNIDPNKKSDKSGFADLGDKKLVYVPDCKSGKPTEKDWPTKTEQFMNDTKNMSSREFAAYMLSEHCSLCNEDDSLPMVSGANGPFHPHPSEAVRYVVALSKNNPRIVDHLIHDAKRTGVLNKLIEAILEHPESYEHLSHLLGDERGEARSNQLARALNKVAEHVGPPQGLSDDDDMGDDEHDSEDHDDMGDDDEHGSDDHDDDMGDMGDDEDHDDHEDEDDLEGSDMDDEEDEDDDQDQPHPDDGEEQDAMPHHSGKANLFNAMKSYMRA